MNGPPTITCRCQIITRRSRDGLPVGRARNEGCPLHGRSVAAQEERAAFDATVPASTISDDPKEAWPYLKQLTVDSVFSNDFRQESSKPITPEFVNAFEVAGMPAISRGADLKEAIRLAEEYIRNPPPYRPRDDIQIVPPALFERLVAKGWLTPQGQWTKAGLEELSGQPPTPPKGWGGL